MKKLLSITLAVVILTACNKNPKNIEKQSDLSESSAAVVSSDMLDVRSPKSVESYSKQIKACRYDNLTVSNDFRLNIGKLSDLGIYEVVFVNDFDGRYKGLFAKYIPSYTAQTEVIRSESNGVKNVRYEDDDNYCLVSSIGGFVISDKKCLNRVLYGNHIKYNRTDLIDTDKDVKYTIGEKTVSLASIIDACNKTITKFDNALGISSGIRPFTFSTQTLDDGKVAGTIHCRNYYKDLPVFDTQQTNDDYTNTIAYLSPITINFIDGADVGQFATVFALRDSKRLQAVEKIVSPEQAVWLTSEKLSEYMRCELKYQELVYFPTCTGNISGAENGNGMDPGDIMTLTPYWVLYFDTDWWHETFAAVNAITGDVDYVNNLG